MSYFDGIKIGDKVWDFMRGYGIVVEVGEEKYENFPIEVEFTKFLFGSYKASYNYNGERCTGSQQTLFWDEVKFEVPQRPKIELKETDYMLSVNTNDVIKNMVGKEEEALRAGLLRDDEIIARKALNQIKRFARLLALRDQECEDSRGYGYTSYEENYYLVLINDKYETRVENKYISLYEPDKVYFKTKEDCEKIADILNSGRFDLDE